MVLDAGCNRPERRRVAAARLRPARLPPTGRNRRSLSRAHGGWQTSRETVYVQATRARHSTDWYIARDQLGVEGQDPDRIERLARQMSNSRLHTPSVAYDELHESAWDPTHDPLRLSRVFPHTKWLQRAREQDDRIGDLERGH
jgi:hypothetical protein